MLCGDLNARTACRLDYVDNDECSNVPLPEDYEPDMSLPRFSKDLVINKNGTNLLELCKASGLRIVNGRTDNDAGVGEFTYTNTNGRSVVDYLLCSEDMFSCITSFEVGSINEHSDHAALHFAVSSQPVLSIDQTVRASKVVRKKYKWDSNCLNPFIEVLRSPYSQMELDRMGNLLSQNPESIDGCIIDEALEIFNKTVCDAADAPCAKFVKSGDILGTVRSDHNKIP